MHRLADGQRREPVQQLVEDRPQLHPCEVAAQAEVRAAAEADLRVGAAGDVEAVGVGEDVGVEVARAVEQHDLLARRDPLPAELGVAPRGAPERQHRARPAHELVDGPVDGAREVLQQQRLLLGVAVQRERGVRRLWR